MWNQYDTSSGSIRGLGLIEMSFFIVASGLVLVAGTKVYYFYTNNERTQKTETNLARAQDALKNYWRTNSRFPCVAPLTAPQDSPSYGKGVELVDRPISDPDDPIVADCSFAAGDGTIQTPGRNGLNVRIGALPVRELGLPDSASLDGWDHRLLYAVTEDYTMKPVASTSLDQGAITIQDSAGNNTTASAGNVIFTVIAAGPDKRGAYGINGHLLQPCDPTSMAGNNCDGDATFVSTTLNSYNMGSATFTAQLAYAAEGVLPNCAAGIPTPLGDTCADPSKAHIYLYDLQIPPIPAPRHKNAGSVASILAGTSPAIVDIADVSHLQAYNRVNIDLYADKAEIPGQKFSKGFPGYPALTYWFGACYDGSYNAPVAGNYTFKTLADDGVAVWIDVTNGGTPADLVLVNQNTMTQIGILTSFGAVVPPLSPLKAPAARYIMSAPVFLTAGPHRVMVKYYQAWAQWLQMNVWVYGWDPDPTKAQVLPLIGPPLIPGPPPSNYFCPH